MQARTAWSPPAGTLGRLTFEARRRADDLAGSEDELRRAADLIVPRPGLASVLRFGPVVGVIGELKRRSPSRGTLRDDLDGAAVARAFARGGAAAISVLTEPESFGGSNADLVAVRQAVSLPVLRKDFHVDPVQLWEARSLGASAALLIARALGPRDTRILADAAREAGLEPLVEVRSAEELEWALDAGAVLVGVNRRNLETLEMEPAVLEEVLPRIPRSCVAIAESGIRSRDDVARVAELGADAVLVGSTLSLSADPAAEIADLSGVSRVARHG